MQEPVVVSPPANQRVLAPQFVIQVRHQLGEILCTAPLADTCPAVDTGGYTVITTLNWQLQRLAEKWTQAGARGPNAADPAAYVKAVGVPYQDWIKNLVGAGVNNAALAAVDYRTGQVLAYAGSAGFYLPGNKQFQPQFDVLEDGWRQPGSAFKAINYLVGIDDHTLTEASMFMDVTTDFGGGYTPTDADLLERGPVLLSDAIHVSINIPAVKAAIEIGPERVFQRSKDFGLRYQSATFTAGSSIGIGTLEVHMIDLISAYGAIANGGVLIPRTTILEVRNAGGQKIWPAAGAVPQGSVAASPQGAFIMTDILAGNTDPAQNPFWSKRAIYDGTTRRPATLKTGHHERHQGPHRDGVRGTTGRPAGPGAGGRRMDGQLGQLGAAIGRGLPRVGSLALAGLHDRRHEGPADRRLPATGGRGPGQGRCVLGHEARTVLHQDGHQVVHRRDGANPGGQHEGRDRGGLRVRQPVAGRLCRAAGGQGLPGPQRRRERLPAVEVVQRWLDCAGHARVRRRRAGRSKTRTSYFYETGVWNPYGSWWGAPFPPTKTCDIASPSPSPEPFPSFGPPPSFDPNASPSPGPGDSIPPPTTGP